MHPILTTLFQAGIIVTAAVTGAVTLRELLRDR